MSPEWVWTLLAVAGMAVGVWGVTDVLSDLRALGEVRNGRRLLVKGDLRAELIRFAIQWSWFWVGLDSIVRPGDGSWSRPVTILIGSIAALLLNSVMSLLLRLQMRRLS